jgi:hypothetical protein
MLNPRNEVLIVLDITLLQIGYFIRTYVCITQVHQLGVNRGEAHAPSPLTV